MGGSGQVQKVLSWGLIDAYWTAGKEEKRRRSDSFLSCLVYWQFSFFYPPFFCRRCLDLDSEHLTYSYLFVPNGSLTNVG